VLEANFLADKQCSECRFHNYPYEAQIPVLVDGSYPIRMMESDEDVWEAINLIVEETKEANAKGGSFSVGQSIMAQLPFFACPNIMLNKEAQNDISRFIYSKDFGVNPYPGSYGEQPVRWIAKSFLIKGLIEKQKSKAIKDGNTI